MAKFFSVRGVLMSFTLVASLGAVGAIQAQTTSLTLSLDGATAYANSGETYGSAVASGTKLTGDVQASYVAAGAAEIRCEDNIAGEVLLWQPSASGSTTFSYTPSSGSHSVSCIGYFPGGGNVYTGTINFTVQ